MLVFAIRESDFGGAAVFKSHILDKLDNIHLFHVFLVWYFLFYALNFMFLLLLSSVNFENWYFTISFSIWWGRLNFIYVLTLLLQFRPEEVIIHLKLVSSYTKVLVCPRAYHCIVSCKYLFSFNSNYSFHLCSNGLNFIENVI